MVRGWSTEKAEEGWSRLERDPDTQRDHLGWKGALRPCVPANLVCESHIECAKGKEEFKDLSLATPEFRNHCLPRYSEIVSRFSLYYLRELGSYILRDTPKPLTIKGPRP